MAKASGGCQLRSGPGSPFRRAARRRKRPSRFWMTGRTRSPASSYRGLREAIISGQLEAGSKINLDRAKQSFNVSLSPLREALARLISDGLVEFEDNRGYRVVARFAVESRRGHQFARGIRNLCAARIHARRRCRMGRQRHACLHRLNRTERDAARPETLNNGKPFTVSFISH